MTKHKLIYGISDSFFTLSFFVIIIINMISIIFTIFTFIRLSFNKLSRMKSHVFPNFRFAISKPHRPSRLRKPCR